MDKKSIKKADLKPNTRIERSIMELSEKGLSKTGISKYNKSHKVKERWTKETAIAASFLWPNQLMIGQEKDNDYYIKIRNIAEHAKRLMNKNVDNIDFILSYYRDDCYLDKRGSVKVLLESEEKALVDDAKVLASLIIERELKDVEPLIICGDVHGKIRLHNGYIDYSIFRSIKTHITNMIDISYLVEDLNEIKLMENIYDISLYGIDKEDGWKSIKFKYTQDIIENDDLVDIVRKKIFERIKERLENHKSSFEGYKTWRLGCVNHHVIPHWDNPKNKLFRMIATVTFEKETKDSKYGVLFKSPEY
jgi:hypothetical protein